MAEPLIVVRQSVHDEVVATTMGVRVVAVQVQYPALLQPNVGTLQRLECALQRQMQAHTASLGVEEVLLHEVVPNGPHRRSTCDGIHSIVSVPDWGSSARRVGMRFLR